MFKFKYIDQPKSWNIRLCACYRKTCRYIMLLIGFLIYIIISFINRLYQIHFQVLLKNNGNPKEIKTLIQNSLEITDICYKNSENNNDDKKNLGYVAACNKINAYKLQLYGFINDTKIYEHFNLFYIHVIMSIYIFCISLLLWSIIFFIFSYCCCSLNIINAFNNLLLCNCRKCDLLYSFPLDIAYLCM